MQCCAVSSEHRVSTSGLRTVSAAEYGCVQLSTCPLERWSRYKDTHSASRMVRVDEVHAAQAVAAPLQPLQHVADDWVVRVQLHLPRQVEQHVRR